MSGDPAKELQREFLSHQIEHLRKISGSVERAHFSAERAQIFKSLKNSKWVALSGTRQSRAEARFMRARRELEVVTGYREISIPAGTVRGPPDPFVDLINSSMRSYDLDPTAWLHDEARLRALSSEIAETDGLPEDLRSARVSDYEIATRLLSEPQLRYFRNAVAAIPRAPAGGASLYLFADKEAHLTEWLSTLDREIGRRSNGGSGLERSANLAALMTKYTQPGGLPSTRAEAHLLQLAAYRFPHRDSMPLGLRHDLAAILSSASQEYLATSISLFKRHRLVGDTLARSAVAVPEELTKRYRESRASLQAIAFHIQSSLRQAESFGADVSRLRDDARPLLAVLPQVVRPDPERQDGLPATPTQQGDKGGWTHWSEFPRPPPGASPSLRRYQPGFEKDLRSLAIFLGEAEARIGGAQEQARSLETGPTLIDVEKGRLQAREESLLAGDRSWRSTKPDPTLSRLPFKWAGRLDKDGQPFAFDSVKSPSRFEPIGGGIHFGETARRSSREDLRSSALIYDPHAGLVLRDGISGRRWVVAGSEGIDPTALKALFRFVAADRNAAVSIGWGSQRESLAERLQSEKEGEAVLLDPYLADTSIGQDLILADLIPWKLGKPTLPNGSAVPFHRQFNTLLEEYPAPARRILREFVGTVAPAKPDVPPCAASLVVSDTTLPPILQAVFSAATTMGEARDTFLNLERSSFRENFERHRVEIEQQIVAELDVYVNLAGSSERLGESQKRILVREEFLARREKQEKAREEKLLSDVWGKLPNDLGKARESLLSLVLLATLPTPNTQNREAVECWVAGKLSAKRSANEIAQDLLDMSGPITLAVLADYGVVFTLSDRGTVDFKTDLRYLYVTSFFGTNSTHVGVSTPKGIEVKLLPELSALVTLNFPVLEKAYPPLAKVKNYAAIAAFLRWARNAEKLGELGLVDLGELGALPGNDRQLYPTVDSLKGN